jgi:hypothetical protein
MNPKLDLWLNRYGTRVALCLLIGIAIEIFLLCLIP